jgi:hypothetical protein
MVVAAQSIVVRKAHKKGSAHVVELKQVRTTRENAERPTCLLKYPSNRTQYNDKRLTPRFLSLFTPIENAEHASFSG